MSTIPPDSNCLLSKARYEAEKILIESVKLKTLEDISVNPNRRLMHLRIKARAYRIAKEVFDSEYESSLGKFLSNPNDKKLLVAIYKDPLICRLIDESVAVFKKTLPPQSQNP